MDIEIRLTDGAYYKAQVREVSDDGASLLVAFENELVGMFIYYLLYIFYYLQMAIESIRSTKCMSSPTADEQFTSFYSE
jgi:hypothetical protein